MTKAGEIIAAWATELRASRIVLNAGAETERFMSDAIEDLIDRDEIDEAGGTDGSRVEEWFIDHFPNSIVSQSTPVYNHVRAAVDDLKRRIGL